MHEIFLLVDFSVGLIVFFMSKNRLYKDLYKKRISKKKKEKKGENTIKKKMFHITFLQDIPIEDM